MKHCARGDAILHHGRVVQIGRGTDIVLNPGNSHVTEFTPRVNMTGSLTASHVMKKPSRAFGRSETTISVLDYPEHNPLGFVRVTGPETTFRSVGRRAPETHGIYIPD